MLAAGQASLHARENFKLIRLNNDTAPGTSGERFFNFSTSIINDDLDIAYVGKLKLGGGVSLSNDDGIWMDDPLNNNTYVGREADQAPGTPVGTTFTNLVNQSTFQLNDAGVFAMRAFVQGGTVTTANDVGIWRQTSGGSLTLVAREGDQAPGTLPGVAFRDMALPAQDNSADGNLFFRTRLIGPGVTGTNDAAIYGYLQST